MKLFGYKKCSSCRDAEKFLTANGIAFEFIDITTNPPSTDALKTYWENSGLELKKFLNTSGEVYREMGLKDKLASLSDKEVLKLLSSNGKLIKRPLIVDGDRATVGAAGDILKSWL